MNACNAFPKSVDLWLLRIDLVNNSETQTESAMSEDQLFQKALDNNGESFKLWSAYVEWIEKKWQDDVLANDVVDDLLTVSDILYSVVSFAGSLCSLSFLVERLPKSNYAVAIAC